MSESIHRIVILLVFTLAAPAIAVAPKVASLEPANGAGDVDPNTTELIVRFDQDMDTSAFSVCGGGPSFPGLRGQPIWQDKRTLVLHVTLEADHAYQMSINCQSYQNCRNTAGEPVPPTPWSFSTSTLRRPEDQRKLNERSSDELLDALKEKYAYFDRTGIDWPARFAKHRDKLLDAASTAEWADRVAKLLRPAKDPHLWMIVGGTPKATYRRKYQGNFRLEAVEKLIGGLTHLANDIHCARTDDNIGYLLIGSWSGDRDARVALIEKQLKAFEDTKSLIVDVRANGGGDELMARAIAQWFVKGEHVYSRNRNRDPLMTDGFTQIYDRRIKGNDTPNLYTRRVALLIGPANISSCESFILMMKQGPRVKTFGARTGGSSGNPKPYTLPNGVEIYIPSWQDMYPDGKLLEGHGIEPDVPVATKMSDFETGDPVLQAALKALRK